MERVRRGEINRLAVCGLNLGSIVESVRLSALLANKRIYRIYESKAAAARRSPTSGTNSAHWRRWLVPRNRCVVPFTSFCEYANNRPKKTPTWFAIDETRPLSFFAGIWTA